MPAAPAGALVRMYYDVTDERGEVRSGDAVRPGDVIETKTRRRYGVVEVRQQTRGKHAGRWHLRCVVLERDEETPGARVWPLYWYPRSRGRGQPRPAR